ncbi:hypothetical protein QBC47DRAFT_389445 [Echria macrotheca]|uniref:NAD(P)-binding protein n=1 Tax=Echria macrotheca TaxID=438768 RepID=A0AAJ0F3A2_9PEZI|nr:hypothetical protein QBC47DRAFT_389445 [Echria macrotheca]
MVKLAEINHANASLKSLPPPTAVVVGATSGIGLSFLRQLAKSTTSPKIYIVGRSQPALTALIASLTETNPSGTYIPILTPDLTLVSNAHAAATEILRQETSQKIDILYLSPGYLTFRARDTSPEDLDRVTALRFYSRMRFVLDLLSLLQRSTFFGEGGGGRVITVLGAGQEGTIYPSDLSLKEKGHTGAVRLGGVASTYTTLFLEELARRYPTVSFVHTFPGVVDTNAYRHPEHLGPVARFLMRWVLFGLLKWFVTTPVEEVGKRTLYAATAGVFAPAAAAGQVADGDVAKGSDGMRGSGCYTVDAKCETIWNRKLVALREQGMGEKVWEHTMAEFERILGA